MSCRHIFYAITKRGVKIVRKNCIVNGWYQSRKSFDWTPTEGAIYIDHELDGYQKYSTAMICFKTPKLTTLEKIKNLHVEIEVSLPDKTLAIATGYALSSSYDYNTLYRAIAYQNTVTGDPYQLGSGKYTVDSSNSNEKMCFDLETDGLMQDTEYYLYFWLSSVSYSYSQLYSSYTLCFNPHNSLEISIDVSGSVSLDNGSEFIAATPHICVNKTDSWNGLFTARTQTSLNLCKGPGTDYDIIASVPSGTDIVVDMIKKSSTDNYAWCRTTYNNDIAWCSLYNSSYTVYARVTNPNGACGYKVVSESDIRLMSECAFPYGSEIVISTENGHSFTVAEDYSTTNRIMYGEAFAYDEYGILTAYHVMMSDVEILSERTYMTFVPAIPHISIRKTECWDGLFEATVNTSDPELYLRSNTSTNYSNLGTIPNETKLTIDDVVIADDGTTILGRTSYNGQTGYANFEYLDYEIYAKVSNPDGTPFYTNKELTNTLTDLSHIAYEKEVLISSNSYCGLVAYNGKILGSLYVIDSDSSRLGGFVRMDDLEYLSERIYYDWVCVMA